MRALVSVGSLLRMTERLGVSHSSLVVCLMMKVLSYGSVLYHRRLVNWVNCVMVLTHSTVLPYEHQQVYIAGQISLWAV